MSFFDKVRELKSTRLDDMAGVKAHERETDSVFISRLTAKIAELERHVRSIEEQFRLVDELSADKLAEADVNYADVLYFGGQEVIGRELGVITTGKEDILKKMASTDPQLIIEISGRINRLLEDADKLNKKITEKYKLPTT